MKTIPRQCTMKQFDTRHFNVLLKTSQYITIAVAKRPGSVQVD